MKLDKLRTIRQELQQEFAAQTVQSSVYYFYPDRWNKLDEPVPVPPNVVACLELADHEEIAHHETSSRYAWFACEDAHCVICLEFPSSPQLAKRKRARLTIRNVLERASNAYKVAHNSLTLLLARDAFRARAEAAVDSLTPAKATDSSDQAVEQQILLALLALDIDHFKQINDSHGHLYGDQVLKAFARRLEQVASDFSSASSSKLAISLGHPSGEEFLILLHGEIAREQIAEIADVFRKAIESERLPNDKEWAQLGEQENLSVLLPPPLHERIVHTSIGFAIHKSSGTPESAKDQVARLIDQADTALYRAKAAGRNQVICFDEILSNCGRVIEQDAVARIVALDIGKNVGVTVGQEFKVYPPGFTGKKKFQVNDGRTTRTIGVYPRFELTRVTVFDVQPEISFAFISNPDDSSVTTEPGSHLEAIPLGSIGHLLPHAARYSATGTDGVRIGDIAPLRAFVANTAETAAKPFAIVFRFSRAEQYLKQFGPAPLNAALARLFRAASTTFHSANATGVLDSASVCVVGKSSVYDEKKVAKFVEELAEETPELRLVAGVFSRTDQDKKVDVGSSPLKPAHAIEFAGFAASDHAIAADSRIAHFDHDVASNILMSLREARAMSQAQADFEKMQALGVVSADLLNLGGLAYISGGNTRKAAELMEAATKRSERMIFKTNYATAAFSLGEVDRPLKVLSTLSDKEFSGLSQYHPYGFVTYARLLAKAKLIGSSMFDAKRFEAIANEALEVEGFKGSAESEVIRRALQKS
jgi:diguanylate cyclase (GGDEF)-like protein